MEIYWLLKKIIATANYISASIVESEILGFIIHEGVQNKERNFFPKRIAAVNIDDISF